MVYMSESPRWLGANRTEAEVRAVLNTLRHPSEVDGEVVEILAKAAEERRQGQVLAAQHSP